MNGKNYLQQELYDLVQSDTAIFEFIQKGMLDGIWYWDLENPEHEWMSPKFWQTLGYDPAEKKHLSSEWQNIINEDDLELASENLKRHLEDPEYPYDQAVRYRHQNGSTVWIRCRGMAIRDDNGKPLRMLGAHTDITYLKETESELSRISSEFEKVFNGTQDAMFLVRVTDSGEFRFIRNNPAHQNKTGLFPEFIRGKTPQDIVGKDIGDSIADNYQRCVDKRGAVTYEETLTLPEGTRFWLTTLTPIIEQDIVTHIVGSSADLTARKFLEDKLETYANYDMLTGLPNRRLFFRTMERLIARYGTDSARFSLLYLDLDGFKEINDTYGHEAGDAYLKEIGKRLQQSIDEDDIAARLGGDEFAVVLQDVESLQSVKIRSREILHTVQQPICVEDHRHQVSVSIGVALFPDAGEDLEVLMRHADFAMYDIKRNGKGGIKIYTSPEE